MDKKLLGLFFLLALQSFGQSQLLKGKIVVDSLQGVAINIVNLDKGIGTVNDEMGYFEIKVSIGDHLYFSSVQFEAYEKEVKEADLKKEEVKIVLLPKVNELEEVTISNIKLTGNLDKDVLSVKPKPFLQAMDLGLPQSKKKPLTQAQRRLYTARSSNGLVPLDLVINMISGRLKKLKKMRELEILDQKVYQGEHAFDSLFFTKELKIPEELITDFVYYCTDDVHYSKLLSRDKKLNLLEFFQEKAAHYITIKKKELGAGYKEMIKEK